MTGLQRLRSSGLALILMLTACTPTTPTATSSPAASGGAPRTGGTLVYGHQVVSTSPLNMLLVTQPRSDYIVGMQIYESLYRITLTGAVEDWLAQKTEISPDSLTWTITLRSGVKFHDGSDFDAAAVKTNLDIRKTHPTFTLKSQMAPIKEVKVVDSKTVQLLLTWPSASLRAVLSSVGFGMQSPTAMAKFTDPVAYSRNAAGTGPFKLDSITTGQAVDLVRNNEYWGQKAYLDKLVFRYLEDPAARIAALEAGDVQFVLDMPATEAVRLQQEGKLNVGRTPAAGTLDYLYFNTAKGPTADKRVRQAIVYGLNLESYLAVTKGLGERADSLIPPNLLGYAKNPLYPYDPAKAKQLLAAAGFKSGTPIEIMTVPTSGSGSLPQEAQLMKQDLDALGFSTTIKVMDVAAMVAALGTPAASSTWQLGILGGTSQYPDSEGLLQRWFHSANEPPVGQNWTHYSNPEVDTLLAKQSAEADPAARQRIMAEIQKILWDDLPTYVVLRTFGSSANAKSVQGVEILPDRTVRFASAWVGQ